jgi:hypothetical protein
VENRWNFIIRLDDEPDRVTLLAQLQTGRHPIGQVHRSQKLELLSPVLILKGQKNYLTIVCHLCTFYHCVHLGWINSADNSIKRWKMKKTSLLKQLIMAKDVLIMPGAFDALSAKIVEQAGFKCTTLGGYPTSAVRLAKPDISLLTLTEMVEHTRYMAIRAMATSPM